MFYVVLIERVQNLHVKNILCHIAAEYIWRCRPIVQNTKNEQLLSYGGLQLSEGPYSPFSIPNVKGVMQMFIWNFTNLTISTQSYLDFYVDYQYPYLIGSSIYRSNCCKRKVKIVLFQIVHIVLLPLISLLFVQPFNANVRKRTEFKHNKYEGSIDALSRGYYILNNNMKI